MHNELLKQGRIHGDGRLISPAPSITLMSLLSLSLLFRFKLSVLNSAESIIADIPSGVHL